MSLFGCCIRKVADVRQLDYRHSGLNQVPSAVFNAERTIEELHIDANQIKVLPRELFHCHGLRVLTLSDNEITSMPAAISSLTNLEKLDVSKNGILELPDNLKTLKYLAILDASVNPLGKLPDGFTQLLNLTQVCLNDCFLEYVPGNFGRLSKLKILELRENHLKTLPQSLSRLTELERLDIGCNEFTELPGSVIGTLLNLLELWCDSNQITNVPKEIGNLKQLMYFDACKNRITELPDEIDGCISLSDLHLSTNLLKTLPHSIGRLSNITTLKVDDNQLLSLPSSIGGLVSLSEFDASANDLEEIPPTIGLLRHLRTLIADENFLSDIPCELGSCSGLTVLSVRSNKLTYLPDEIGRIPRLRVLNLSDNEIKVLPYSLMNLTELQALWLAENQSKALIRLQGATDPETQRRCLTCYLLPQQRMDPIDSYGDDNQSFHPSLWDEQREQRLQIQFEDTGQENRDEMSAYPKEMRIRTRHLQNEAIRKVVGGGDEDAEKSANNVDMPESGLLLCSAPGSPKTSTHRLVKLEKFVFERNYYLQLHDQGERPCRENSKQLVDCQHFQTYTEQVPKPCQHDKVHREEKIAKDKARINHLSQEVGIEEVQLRDKTDSAKHSDLKKYSHKSKERRNSKLSDKEYELSTVTTSSSSKLNGSVRHVNHTSISAPSNTQNKPKTIQNGHYHASSSSRSINELRHGNADVQRTPSNRSSVPHSQSFPTGPVPPHGSHQSLRGQPYDRYLTSQLQLQGSAEQSNPRANDSRLPRSRPSSNQSDPRGSAARLSSNNNTSQDVLNQEDTFGIFTSDEDPKLYQRRFKYYQRMRKHRKNPEVRSDLGYYHGQYNGGASKTASDSGHRHRRPLQQGHDGFDQWERYSQRSVGDGYASDVEGFVHGGKRLHHVSNHMQSTYRPAQKPLNDSRVSVGENRPAVPPSYNTAMAKRSESIIENTSFPPPPPYKPPARDPGPDGASNDGVPRSSPNLETPADSEDVPFKTYTEAKLRNVTATVINMNNTYGTRQDPPGNRRQHMTSTPLTPSQSNSQRVSVHGNNHNRNSDQIIPSYYSPIENYSRAAPVQRSDSNPRRPVSTQSNNQQQLSGTQRSSFYNSNYIDDGTIDSEYAAQISKSLGRLGYNRESDKKLARPPVQFSGDVDETVPPPALFGSSQADHNSGKANANDLYGIVDKAGSGNYAMYKALPANTNSHTPSQRRSYQASTSSHHLSNGHLPNMSASKQTSNYGYLPPPSRKSPKLPHKQIIASGLEVDDPPSSKVMNVSIAKNPGLGFSVAGGVGLQGNPYRPMDEGIFVTKLHSNGAATSVLQPGDKILTVNGIDFTHMEHKTAVNLLKHQPTRVDMTIERRLATPTDV